MRQHLFSIFLVAVIFLPRKITGLPLTNPGSQSDEYSQLLAAQRNLSMVGGGAIGYNGTFNLSCTSCEHYSRDKQIRIWNIRNYVLNSLGHGKAPISTASTTTTGIGSNNRALQPSVFSGEIKTFYASCKTPPRVDEEAWSDPFFLNLYFEVSANANGTGNTTNPLNGNKNMNALSAKLRLYKIAPIVGIGLNNGTSHNGSSVGSGNETSTGQSSESSLQNSLVPTETNEEKIRVSVYSYKAPVTKTHYKKKLLDTKMVGLKDSNWIDFDIIKATIPWIDRKDKNFGIVVQVENEDDDLVDPHTYFAGIDCQRSRSNVSVLPVSLQLTPPQLEICMLNIPHTQKDLQPTEPPMPFQMQMGLSHLSRIAKTHERSQQRETAEWPNDQIGRVPTSTKAPMKVHHIRHHSHGHHRRSQHHSSSTTPSTSTTGSPFRLDEDHPLRRILTTNITHRVQHLEAADDSVEADDRDVIIQKIYFRGGNKDEQEDR